MLTIRLMKKAQQCELKSTIEAKLYYFLISPTDDDHAISFIFTQRFSVGHFWSPYRITTTSIFYKLHITTNNSISYKHSVSIS